MIFAILAISITVTAAICIFFGVKRVPQGYEYTVERFGKFTHCITPGLNIIIPVIDAVGHKINMMERVMDVEPQDIISSDNAMVMVDAVCFFQIVKPERAAYEVLNLDLAITNLITTNVRTVLGEMELDSMLGERDKINTKLLKTIGGATSPWGVKVTRIEIKKIEPPREMVNAMARQMKAEREKRAKILEAEGDKESAIRRAEGRKQAVVLEAEANKEATFQAAEARERQAQAEANAIKSVEDGASTNSDAIRYFVAKEYISAFGRLAASRNSKVIMMPADAAGMMGAVGGITELLNDSKGKQQ